MSSDIPELAHLDRKDQLQLMEEWFRARYEDPANRTPRDDGEYVYIWGGPYDAQDVLGNAFGDDVPDDVIEELSTSLDSENWEWAPAPSEDDYDRSFFDVVSENKNAFVTFHENIANIQELIKQCSALPNVTALYPLFFANVITALETYLSDTFINKVLANQELVRKLLETTPEFKKRQISFSDVLSEAEKIPEEAKRYLLDVVWHNLGKVQAMYRDTLDVDFRSSVQEVASAISVRHDIVHRNGKKKDGSIVAVGSDDLQKLIKNTADLVYNIEGQLDKPANGP